MFLYQTGLFLFAAILFWLPLLSFSESGPFAVVDSNILGEIQAHNELLQNLQYLSDDIGPRLTGSPQQKQASDWAAAKFRSYGLSNVHFEPWVISHSWTRGTARARIVDPVVRNMTVAAAGWSPSTAGTLRGHVVYMDAEKKEDLEKYRGKLSDAIVMIDRPTNLVSSDLDMHPPFINPIQDPEPLSGEIPAKHSLTTTDFSRARMDLFKSERVAAVLRDSNKPYGLLNMVNGSSEYAIGSVPTAVITHEDYLLILRLLKRKAVKIEIEISNTFSEGSVEVSNTIAEIPGIEKPEEVVILAAHLDSWDLASGSTDNGTGSMAVLEAARAVAKLGLKPKRTLRFILFTGEEQGLVGSAKYIEAHKREMGKISAVLVHDTGTGPLLTVALHHNYQDRELMDYVLAPLRELKLVEPRMARSTGSDYAPFNEFGVPGFSCIADSPDYQLTHHTQADTFDKVRIDGLTQAAQVLAAWAYNTAQLPELLPRRQ